MADEWIFVPILVMFFFFAAIVLVVKYITQYRQSVRALTSGGGQEYRRLADEAVRSQRELLEAVRAMNQTMQEIERLLKEV